MSANILVGVLPLYWGFIHSVDNIEGYELFMLKGSNCTTKFGKVILNLPSSYFSIYTTNQEREKSRRFE